MKAKTLSIQVELDYEEIEEIFELMYDTLNIPDSDKRQELMESYPKGKLFYLFLKHIIIKQNKEIN